MAPDVLKSLGAYKPYDLDLGTHTPWPQMMAGMARVSTFCRYINAYTYFLLYIAGTGHTIEDGDRLCH